MIDLGHTLHVYIWLISKNLKMLIDKKIKRKNRKKRKIKYFLSKIEYKYSKIFFFFRKKKFNTNILNDRYIENNWGKYFNFYCYKIIRIRSTIKFLKENKN